MLGLLSHVDTVVADPEGWRHGPWSGELDEGCVWGRGALDMKSQTAAEAVAAASLASEGWRPEQGDLLVISVSDEEVGGTGAQWLTAEHPELVRCDYLLNEGGGESVEIDGERAYTMSVGEKGVFRFTLTTDGAAGHASLPAVADNALLKLAPLLEAMKSKAPGWDVTPAPRALLAELGLDGDPSSALAALERARARVRAGGRRDDARDARPDDGRRLGPDERDPRDARGCTWTAACRRGWRSRRCWRACTRCSAPPATASSSPSAWWATGHRRSRRWPTPCAAGSSAPIRAPAACRPCPSGYSDSRTFRDAFPDCVAYGFFPHRHMAVEQLGELVHGRDERIDVRDLGLAVDCYRAVATELLG